MTATLRHPQSSAIRQRGFTLVEAVVVMVVTGILAGIMVLFISRPVQNYTDAAARADLSEAADLALRRMARELRTALPNSVRLTVLPTGQMWLEFIPTKSGGKYLSAEDNPDPNAPVPGKPLSFTNATAAPFNVIGSMPDVSVGDFFAIYNLGVGFTGADAYAGTNLARVTAVDTANRSISYDSYGGLAGSNPFAVATGGIPNTSPGQRFQVVTRPVIFRCQGSADGTGTLTRSVAADFSSTPPQPGPLVGNLMANNVVACSFTIGTLATQQSALIGLSLSLGRPNPGGGGATETITLTHQIHVDNIP